MNTISRFLRCFQSVALVFDDMTSSQLEKCKNIKLVTSKDENFKISF